VERHSEQRADALDRDDGRVTTFRNPSGYSNGNTFDYEGRQLSCEHGGRRSCATSPTARRRSSPRSFRASAELAERRRRPSRRRHLVHRSDLRHPRQLRRIQGEQESKEAVYRVDPKTGQIDKVTDEVGQPNGICFLPDYKKLYVADTGTRETKVWDVDGKPCAMGSGSSSSIFLERRAVFRRRAFAATWTGTSGPARDPACQVIAPSGERIGMIPSPGDLSRTSVSAARGETVCS
jgi:gluconolactonase